MRENSGRLVKYHTEDGWQKGKVLYGDQVPAYSRHDKVFIRLINDDYSDKLDENGKKVITLKHQSEVTTIGLLGFDGGKLKDLCQHCILVKSAKGAYAPVEDIHLIITHIIATYFILGPDGSV